MVSYKLFFYRHKVLNNQEIKLIQGNSNLNKNCILPIEQVDHLFNPIGYLVSTGRHVPIQLIGSINSRNQFIFNTPP